MPNRVLWTIDNELDGRTFERLCVDLLYRNGYRDIVPIEPQDGGRDAEEFPRRGRGRAGEATFFQFSLEKGWKGKLRRDARKLDARGIEFSTFVFVTSQKARGVDVDLLTAEYWGHTYTFHNPAEYWGHTYTFHNPVFHPHLAGRSQGVRPCSMKSRA